MGAHINEQGEWQSDKYPGCPAGKVPLSTKDVTAQDLLWEYAQRRRAMDAEFADDLEYALRAKGYLPPDRGADEKRLAEIREHAYRNSDHKFVVRLLDESERARTEAEALRKALQCDIAILCERAAQSARESTIVNQLTKHLAETEVGQKLLAMRADRDRTEAALAEERAKREAAEFAKTVEGGARLDAYWQKRAETAEARIAELETAVRDLLASAHPHPVEHPTMTAAWARARAALGAKADAAKEPAQ